MIERIDALLGLRHGEALRLELRIGQGDRLDGLDPPRAIDAREVDLRHQPVVAAQAEAGHLGRAGMQEVAEPIKDQGLAIEFDALHHVGVVAEDQIDSLLLGGEGSPVGKLALVGRDAALEPVMD
jgi:hypothetical protein